MEDNAFRMPLYLPAQGAAETEATIIEWCVSEGDRFEEGQVLGKIDSAKSVFDFVAPCSGTLIRLLHLDGDVISYDQSVMEIETADTRMKDSIPPAAVADEPPATESRPVDAPRAEPAGEDVVFLGFGGYVPDRVVTNAELVQRFPGVTDDYVFSVTGIRERHWAANDEKPSDMAYAAALDALRRTRIATRDIDAIILATTTPDVAMPATACIVQDRLGMSNAFAFDLNAACSGWLYAVSVGRALILSGTANTVLTIGVDIQSRLLDPTDQATSFLFGDGAGAAILAAGSGHRICHAVLGSDTRGLDMIHRNEPGHFVRNGEADIDPWVRIDGPALFRFATESFSALVRQTLVRTGWHTDQVRWVVPHQANARILKAAAKRSGVPFDRFFMNVDDVGNTSSASIPLALLDIESELVRGDRLILCAVGAGITTGAVSVEW